MISLNGIPGYARGATPVLVIDLLRSLADYANKGGIYANQFSNGLVCIDDGLFGLDSYHPPGSRTRAIQCPRQVPFGIDPSSTIVMRVS